MPRPIPTAGRRIALIAAIACLAPCSQAALAQPVDLPIPPATTEKYPPGVHVGKVDGSRVYLDATGRVLYGLDMRVLLRAAPDPAKYCSAACAKSWEPLSAPGATPDIAFPAGGRPAPAPPGSRFYTQPQEAPDWTVIAGAQGPQWVYKGWHLVFALRGADARSTRFDGSEDRAWNTLKFMPPAPKLVAPSAVRAIPRDGAYVLADGKGRLLFSGDCGRDCSGWQPFAAGMASASVGEWRVSLAGDQPQWTRQGRPIYVATDDAPTEIPARAKVLRP